MLGLSARARLGYCSLQQISTVRRRPLLFIGNDLNQRSMATAEKAAKAKKGSSSSSSSSGRRGRGSPSAAASVAPSSAASTQAPSTLGKAMAAAAETQGLKGPLKLMTKAATVDYGKNRPNLVLGTGLLATQCDSAALGVQGGASVLATVVSSRADPAAGNDFLPLAVEYREKAHAYGRMTRLATRREGIQTDKETLSSRVVDRVIRPLFPDGYFNETQVVTTVQSADDVNDTTVLAVNAASTALCLSPLPWEGPVGCVRVGLVDGKLMVNPTEEEMGRSKLDLLYAGNERRTLMIEAGGEQIREEDMIRALKFAHFHCGPVINAQKQLMKEVGAKKWDTPLAVPTPAMIKLAEETGYGRAVEIFKAPQSKTARSMAEAKLHQDVREAVKEAFPDCHPLLPALCSEMVVKKGLRDAALVQGRRCDGRGFQDLRHISCDADVLPGNVHGSAVFTRGETQVLCAVTLGSDEDALPERFPDEHNKASIGRKAFLHYDFPPYSVNEIGKVFGANRRMVGHGALAEKAILPVMPSTDDFPYTVRITSEVTQSNGSSSMASACGASLALMDAGVPIKAPVAGVSVGLLTYPPPAGSRVTGSDGSTSQLMIDILGLEDHYGDMDFKVAGTMDGITAIQLDIKLQGGVALETLCDGIRLASQARKQILGTMRKAIAEPNKELKPTAPGMEVVHFPAEQHKELFTLENRRLVEDEYEVALSFPQEGKVTIFGRDPEKVARAHQHVQELVSDVQEGETYTATVMEIKDFGAVVEVLRGREGLLHFTELSHRLSKPVNQLLTVGQQVKVKCLQVDRVRGLVRVSRKALLDPQADDHLRPHADPTVLKTLKVPVPPGTTYTHVDMKLARKEMRERERRADERRKANDRERERPSRGRPGSKERKRGKTEESRESEERVEAAAEAEAEAEEVVEERAEETPTEEVMMATEEVIVPAETQEVMMATETEEMGVEGEEATGREKKGRGRPKKAASDSEGKTDGEGEEVKVKRGRGRPKKEKAVEEGKEEEGEKVVKKGRGRPKKVKADEGAGEGKAEE